MADKGGSVRRRGNKAKPSPEKISNDSQEPQKVKRRRAPLHISAVTVFSILVIAHTAGALYHPIQDCDETFNYWEPTHYVTHGHGFQTWEYSPEYAIRSWAYAGLHALLSLPGRLLGSKTIEFYSVRILLGIICAACGTRFYSVISVHWSSRIAALFLIIMATSPGIFHASVAYLPSSFSMYTTMLGMASFMDFRGRLRVDEGVFWCGAGACLGWPFAAAMAIPFIVEKVAYLPLSGRYDQINFAQNVAKGAAGVLCVLGIQTAIDAFFYGKVVSVPFNIVWYNVFARKGGPDLYGTEPWHFYLRNLFLNFHLWLVLALIAIPLQLLALWLNSTPDSKKTIRLQTSFTTALASTTPFYLWLAIFTLQPHKEERFMYPAYPALALNAAVAMDIIAVQLMAEGQRGIFSWIPQQFRIMSLATLMQCALLLSLFRTMGTITAYNAPLSIYTPLHKAGIAKPNDTLCLGKEWYRFPSHHLLPDTMRAKFIQSEFTGLLPGHFITGNSASHYPSILTGTRAIPEGMNDENREDASKYTKLKDCAFLVDSRAPSTLATRLEPDYIADIEHWERVKCLPFLDSAATGVLGRLGWVPDLPFVPERFRRIWGEQCLLRRRKRQVAGAAGFVVHPAIETLG